MPSEKNMRVLVAAKGGPEVLKLVEEDFPEPQAGELRVRVLAA
jgi:NADPH:quinone reductase-like Zn-dependent oxidoreductase